MGVGIGEYEILLVSDGTVFFDPSRHIYWLEMEGCEPTYLPSVSGITGMIDKSDVLLKWAKGLARKYCDGLPHISHADLYDATELYEIERKRAARHGIEVHSCVEGYLQGNEPPADTPPEVRRGFESFLRFQDKYKPKWLLSEWMVYSHKHLYAGKPDLLAEIEGEKILIDIKTSNQLYEAYHLQTAGYVLAHNELHDDNVERRWLLHLDKKTGKPKVRECQNLEDDIAAFLGLLLVKERLAAIREECKKRTLSTRSMRS